MENQVQNNIAEALPKIEYHSKINPIKFSKKPIFYIFLIFALIIVSGYAGYLYGVKETKKQIVSLPVVNPLKSGEKVTNPSDSTGAQNNPQKSSSLVKKQEALAVGVITEYDKNTITVKSDDNTQGILKLAPYVLTYPLEIQEGKPVMGTRDKSAIKTGQRAVITLSLVGNEYLVTNITYIKK